MKESPYLDPEMVAVYDRIAARFQFAAPASDLVKIVGVSEGGVVLDVGTGTGVVAAAARTAVGITGTVIATDAAFEMIQLARKETPHIVVAHVPGLPFADGTFDAVIAGFVVSHFESYIEGLRAMVRVCRTGGRVGMSAWGSAPNPAASLWSDIAAEFGPREELNGAFRKQIPWDQWFSRIENVVAALRAGGLSSGKHGDTLLLPANADPGLSIVARSKRAGTYSPLPVDICAVGRFHRRRCKSV